MKTKYIAVVSKQDIAAQTILLIPDFCSKLSEINLVKRGT